MNKPDFIIIGAAKSATTTLYQYLCRHPEVYMSTPKEPDFFSLDTNYAKGLDWYESLFTDAKANQICGEASTTYSRLQRHPKTVYRLVKYLPEVKLIYMMRHPVDRAYSFYVYRFKGSQRNADFLKSRNEFIEAKTFEQAIKEQSEFIDSSYYLYQIKKYLEVYPKDNLLCLLMEDLVNYPEKTLNQIYNFIGVNPDVDLTTEGEIFANKGSEQREGFVRESLMSPIKKVPGMNLISKLLPQEAKDAAYQTIKKIRYNKWKEQQYQPPPMLPETREMLLAQFREPNQKLAEFLGRDLSHWNK